MNTSKMREGLRPSSVPTTPRKTNSPPVNYNRRCYNCRQPLREHYGVKCLFQPTEFLAEGSWWWEKWNGEVQQRYGWTCDICDKVHYILVLIKDVASLEHRARIKRIESCECGYRNILLLR